MYNFIENIYLNADNNDIYGHKDVSFLFFHCFQLENLENCSNFIH